MNGTEVGTDVGGNTNAPTSITALQLTINQITTDRLSQTDNNTTDQDPDKPDSDDGTGKKSRAWFITLNNPTPDEIAAIEKQDAIYKVYQWERGAECQTVHIHAVLYYKNPRVWGKRWLPRARWEIPRKLQSAIDYCKKEPTRINGPFEFGTIPQQGRRKDLEEAARNYLANGEAAFVVENPDIFIRYYRGLRELRAATFTHRDRNTPPVVTWLWGKSGRGKTLKAVDNHPNSFYIKDGTQWWDDYKQEEAIIIDDFDGKWPYRDLLRLLDRYPYQGQVKGGYVKINSPFIYITCEHPPDYWWVDNEYDQVRRRLTTIEHIETDERAEQAYGMPHRGTTKTVGPRVRAAAAITLMDMMNKG